MSPLRLSARTPLPDGKTAIAPRVDDPRGFAVQNAMGQEITVWFGYDANTHLMTVVVEAKSSAARLPPEETEVAGEAHGDIAQAAPPPRG